MIASLHGTLESLGSDSAIINVSGVGFQVYMPTSIQNGPASAGRSKSAQAMRVSPTCQAREETGTSWTTSGSRPWAEYRWLN